MLELSPAEQVKESLNISDSEYLSIPCSPENAKHKPWGKSPPYHCNPNGVGFKKESMVTSAKPTEMTTQRHQNLTLNDWLTVFAYIDEHPDVPQGRIAEHFKTHPEDTLEFTQATLSWKLKDQTKLKEHVHSNPNALSSKRPQIVTQPDCHIHRFY